MKKTRIIMASIFALAIGSAFTTNTNRQLVLDPHYKPTLGNCQPGVLDTPPQGTCDVQAGTQCTITDLSGMYNAFDMSCTGSAIKYN